MKKLFVVFATISFIACNNKSNTDISVGTNSRDTVNMTENVDGIAAGSDSVETKINITPTSDSADKASQ